MKFDLLSLHCCLHFQRQRGYKMMLHCASEMWAIGVKSPGVEGEQAPWSDGFVLETPEQQEAFARMWEAAQENPSKDFKPDDSMVIRLREIQIAIVRVGGTLALVWAEHDVADRGKQHKTPPYMLWLLVELDEARQRLIEVFLQAVRVPHCEVGMCEQGAVEAKE